MESQKQASHSFHEPLEISPQAGEIPTFPQLRRRGLMEKWKTKSRFSTFPPPRILISRNPKTPTQMGYRPWWRSTPPHPDIYEFGNIFS
jgi:hypothetical protein